MNGPGARTPPPDRHRRLTKQVPGLPAQPGAMVAHTAPSLVAQAWNHCNGSLKPPMTWLPSRDGSRNGTFGDHVKVPQGR